MSVFVGMVAAAPIYLAVAVGYLAAGLAGLVVGVVLIVALVGATARRVEHEARSASAPPALADRIAERRLELVDILDLGTAPGERSR